jgi:uncharacterized protein involved in exopolysaccharide biosynthesis
MLFRLLGLRWFRGVLCLTIGVGAGCIAAALWPFEYTSEATLRVAPVAVPQELIQRSAVDAKRLMDELVPGVLSTASITMLIRDRDLYPSRLDPMDALVARFRRSLRVEQQGPNLIRIAFRYGERADGEDNAKKAQIVTGHLASTLIDMWLREEATSRYASQQFFSDGAEASGKQLVKAEQRLRATPASDPRYPVLSLDRDLKRKEYESIGEKRAQASLLERLSERKQDQNLELLEPATLPDNPDTSPWFPRFGGLMCGAALWLLIECSPGRRAPASQEAEEGSHANSTESVL